MTKLGGDGASGGNYEFWPAHVAKSKIDGLTAAGFEDGSETA
jgi:hypothetical protein